LIWKLDARMRPRIKKLLAHPCRNLGLKNSMFTEIPICIARGKKKKKTMIVLTIVICF
jgi:hypothetical protein